MKVLFAGLGSVGQRHLRNARKILGDDLEALAYRQTDHDHVIRDGRIEPGQSLAKTCGLTVYRGLDEALSQRPVCVFIANPSSMHIPVALKAARAGAHIFLEKPVSHNLEGVQQLREIARVRDLRVMVGYQTRFHPAYRVLQEILDQRALGRIQSAEVVWETYLPAHHPYEDYRQGYAARRDLGGGVVLGLIHELDLIVSLFGQPSQVSAAASHAKLGLAVEESVAASLIVGGEDRPVPLTLRLSYAQKREQRYCRIMGDRAQVVCDWTNAVLTLTDGDGMVMREQRYDDLERNDLFAAEVREFFSAIRDHRSPVVTLEDGVESLTLALRIKEACGE